MRYELRDPVRLVGKTTGKAHVEADAIEMRPPKARAFVTLEQKGLLRRGRETELAVELLKACGVASEVVDEMSIRDVQGAFEEADAQGFFGPSKRPETTQESEEEHGVS